MNKTQRSIFDQSVADRIERLLARCDAVRRGSEIDRPHVFNADGERHAHQVASRDRQSQENPNG